MIYYETGNGSRYINPMDITLERGYSIEVFAEGLDAPSSILFTEDGHMFISNSGLTNGNPSISELRNGRFEVFREIIQCIEGHYGGWQRIVESPLVGYYYYVIHQHSKDIIPQALIVHICQQVKGASGQCKENLIPSGLQPRRQLSYEFYIQASVRR